MLGNIDDLVTYLGYSIIDCEEGNGFYVCSLMNEQT